MKGSWLLAAALALPFLTGCGQKAYTRTTAVTPAPVQSGPFLAVREQDAQCGSQTPVWADANGNVYYVKGEPQYGHTPDGGYLCVKDARAWGYHAYRRD